MLLFIEAHALTDVWHTMNPFVGRYMVRARSLANPVFSRLDYFLTSPAMLTAVTNAEIEPSYCIDHNPITLDMVISEMERGKGYWKFPEFLLSDRSFCSELISHIKQLVHDNFGTEPGLLWETVKAGIQGFTIEYLG